MNELLPLKSEGGNGPKASFDNLDPRGVKVKRLCLRICERPDLLAGEKVAAGAQIQSNSPLELLWILENAVPARVEWKVLPQRGYLSKSNDPSR